MNKIKVGILILVIFAGLIGIPPLGFIFSFWSLTYWWILVFTISIIWKFQVGSGFILWTSFLIFLLSALLVSGGLQNLAETFMRISFLGWIIGLIQSFVEYKNLKSID